MDNFEVIKLAENILNNKLRCIVPFEHLLFFPNGDVCTCCPALVNHYTLGNIFTDSSDAIWNGEKAKKFIQSIIDGNFQYCNLESCLPMKNLKSEYRFCVDDERWRETLIRKFSKEVHFNIDTTCNARCIMCRDEHPCMQQEINNYFSIIDEKLLPLLKETEIVYLNGSGELFASKLCKYLVSKIITQYPNIKFNIITNGILANEKNFEKLSLMDRILSLEISMHAYSENVYNQIVRDGNYKKVMDNLLFLSGLKKQGKIPFFKLNFVVNSMNYQEMIAFQEFANQIGAETCFWEYRVWGNAELDKHYKEVAVFEPEHPEYNSFLEIINNDIFKTSKCHINAKLLPC